MTFAASRCLNARASRVSSSSPSSNFATETGPSFRYPSAFASVAKRLRRSVKESLHAATWMTRPLNICLKKTRTG